MNYQAARDLLLSLAHPLNTERISLDQSEGRVLAGALTAEENVPAFDRSPYDGYAFRSQDTADASKEHPVTLQILEEVPAGSVPVSKVTEGTAVKILTGAPIPEGADAVIMYEKTQFTAQEVTLFSPVRPGDNIVFAGEDVRKGELLAKAGMVIDPGLAGALASQGQLEPLVYRKPVIGIISTGSELAEPVNASKTAGRAESGDSSEKTDVAAPVRFMAVPAGKIRNSNRYTFAAALARDGGSPVYLGTASDDAEEIAALIRQGLSSCDMVLLTGGVSAGDYDLTPEAMELAGCELLVKGVGLKPGMACCYGISAGKLVCGLSGNPSSALTNYYAVLRPSVRRITGRADYLPEEITVTLGNAFRKKSKGLRLIKGRLRFEDGQAVMDLPKGQGNVMISSSIGCDLIGIVPAGSGPLEQGTRIQAFLV